MIQVFANIWETRGLKRSRVRRRGFCKPDLADIVAAEHHCCYFCFFFFSVSLSPTHLSRLFSFFNFTFWFSPHMNFWWKFKLRWEVRGLCLYLHSFTPTWSCDQVKRHGLKLWTDGHEASFQPFTQAIQVLINGSLYTILTSMYIYSPIVIKVPYFHLYIYIYIYYWLFKFWNHRLPLLLLIDWLNRLHMYSKNKNKNI